MAKCRQANGAPKEGKALPGHMDVREQQVDTNVTRFRNVQEGLGPVQSEIVGWTISLDDLWRPTKSAIIEVPDVNFQIWHVGLDGLCQRLQSKRKPQGSQGVSLLSTTTARDDDLTQVKHRPGSIAALHPRGKRRDPVPDLSENGGSINTVKAF